MFQRSSFYSELLDCVVWCLMHLEVVMFTVWWIRPHSLCTVREMKASNTRSDLGTKQNCSPTWNSIQKLPLVWIFEASKWEHDLNFDKYYDKNVLKRSNIIRHQQVRGSCITFIYILSRILLTKCKHFHLYF